MKGKLNSNCFDLNKQLIASRLLILKSREDGQIVEKSSDCSDVSRELVKNTLKCSGLQLIAEEVAAKKCKKSISFSAVTAYYFPRAQGFTCVPSVSVLDKHEVDTASHSKQSRQTR